MKRIEILGLSTTYSDEGKGNVLLFLHGWGGSAKSFDSIKNLLPGRKICLDLWGFGGSSPPSEAWGVADYARAVYFFIRKLNLESVSVVSHSFGGRIAVTLSALYPHCVKRLALLSAAGFRTKNLSVRFRIFVYKAAKSLKKRGFRVKIPDFSSSDYKSTPMKSTFLRVVGEDLSPLAAKITAPTLLVYGKSDKATPPSFCRRYARLIRNSEAFVIRGSHFVMDDSPFEVASLINGFLPS